MKRWYQAENSDWLLRFTQAVCWFVLHFNRFSVTCFATLDSVSHWISDQFWGTPGLYIAALIDILPSCQWIFQSINVRTKGPLKLRLYKPSIHCTPSYRIKHIQNWRRSKEVYGCFHWIFDKKFCRLSKNHFELAHFVFWVKWIRHVWYLPTSLSDCVKIIGPCGRYYTCGEHKGMILPCKLCQITKPSISCLHFL